jgi:hypothetical protein
MSEHLFTEEEQKKLQDYAEQYADYKSKIEPLEKKCKSINTSIKQMMELYGIDVVPLADGRTLKYSVSTKDTLDEEKLIVQLKHFAPDTECIKTKEYIDMDILESEIYHGKLSNDAMVAMDGCRSTKEIPKLTIEKAKAKK